MKKHPLTSKKSKVWLVAVLAFVLCTLIATLAGCAPDEPQDPDDGLEFIVPEGPADETFGLNGETPTDISYFKYEEIDDGTIAITGTYTQATELTKIVIPAVIDGKKVSRLYDSALATLYSLEEVVVSGYVVDIRPYAFRDCWSLKTIKLPGNLLRLSEGAFQGCKSIKDLSFIVPSVKVIGDRVFEGCESLSTAKIPDTVTKVGEYTFLNCTSLTEVQFASGMTTIPNRMFQGCSALVKTTGSDTFVIPAKIDTIGEFAFSGCVSLTKFSIPDTVKNLGKCIFVGCEALSEVAFPAGITAIPERMFDGCISLKTTTGNTEFVIPETVKTIGESAFNECNFRDVVLNNGLETIGKNAFANCQRARNISIPDTVKSVGELAFSGCTMLKEIKMPIVDKMTIGKNIFDGCKKLEKITVKSGSDAESYANDWAGKAAELDKYAAITVITQ